MSKYTKLYLGETLIRPSGTFSQGEKGSRKKCARTYQKEEKVNMQQFGHIDGRALKNLIDTKTSMVILDARVGKWDNGRRIPGGKLLPANSSPELFTQVAPDKDALVVVYCGSITCPAGKALAERMIGAGYRHILEYAGGMKEWADELNYSVERS